MKHLKKTVVFILLVIATFVALFWLKFNYSHHLASRHTGLKGILEEEKSIDYLFVGSSHTRMSYDMKQFCEETGSNSYVLAYNGLSYYFTYPILKHLLENTDVKVKTLVLENYVVTASTTPVLQDKWTFLEAPPNLKKDLLTQVADSPEGMDWRQFYELTVSSKNQDLIVSPLTERFLAKAFYRGTRLVVETKALSQKAFDDLPSPLDGADTVIDPDQMAALKKTFELLKEHQVQALFVESPMPGPTEKDAHYRHNKRVLKETIESAGFKYVDGAIGFPVDDHKNFRDAGHLSGQGRELFTDQVINSLRGHWDR